MTNNPNRLFGFPGQEIPTIRLNDLCEADFSWLVYSPNEKYMACVSSLLSTISIWELESLHRVLQLPQQHSEGIAFSKDDSLIASYNHDGIDVWHLTTGEQVCRYRWSGQMQSELIDKDTSGILFWPNNGSHQLLFGWDNWILILDIKSNRVLQTIRFVDSPSVQLLYLSPSIDDYQACYITYVNSKSKSRSICLKNIFSGHGYTEIQLAQDDFCRIMPSGKRLLIGRVSQQATDVWNLSSQQYLSTLPNLFVALVVQFGCDDTLIAHTYMNCIDSHVSNILDIWRVDGERIRSFVNIPSLELKWSPRSPLVSILDILHIPGIPPASALFVDPLSGGIRGYTSGHSGSGGQSYALSSSGRWLASHSLSDHVVVDKTLIPAGTIAVTDLASILP